MLTMQSFHPVSATARGLGSYWGKNHLLMHQFGRLREMRLTSRLGSLVFCHVQQSHHHGVRQVYSKAISLVFRWEGRKEEGFLTRLSTRVDMLKSVMDIWLRLLKRTPPINSGLVHKRTGSGRISIGCRLLQATRRAAVLLKGNRKSKEECLVVCTLQSDKFLFARAWCRAPGRPGVVQRPSADVEFYYMQARLVLTVM
ncbi:hypothetical protein BKA81DRAFT_96548 [Phyllosticta paracitricarpa]